jgi:trimeric autotransporter adhesin
MRRYFILVVLFLLSLPLQFSILGCGQNPSNFCNTFGQGFGQRKGVLYSITLQPAQTGVSLSYGQVGQLQTPTGVDCAGTTVSVGTVTYGTSDLQNADISPGGAICAGRWNRATDGGVAPFTTCLPTNSPVVADITATAGSVSSNVVKIYVHPTVTSVSLDTVDQATGVNLGNGGACLSQFQTAQLNASAFVTDSTGSHLYCAPVPNPQGVPDCSVNLGHLSYAAQSTSFAAGSTASNTVVTIDENGVATARLPGTALITASVSGISSSAGSFSTCPPRSITLAANGGSNVIVNPNTPVPITATVVDTNGTTITGVQLNFVSTDPRTIGVSAASGITSIFPGAASVYAVCQPGACNPAPIDHIGLNGTGTPVASNTLSVTSPGTSTSLLWLASPLSQYFVSLDLSQNTVGTPIRLPYVPNSMVISPPVGNTSTTGNLYFGSYRELMAYSFNGSNASLTVQDTTVPGVVLAVSPNGQVLINDQDRQIFYVYSPASSSGSTTGGNGSSGSRGTPASIVTQYGGVGQRAAFSPDGNTLYILGTNKLYVYSTFTGWTTETLDPANATAVANCPANAGSDPNTTYNIFCSPDLALAVPHVGAYLSGQNTSARGYCADTRQTVIDDYPSAVPAGATGYNFASDHLAATADGRHVISATAGANPLLIDSDVVLPTNQPTDPSGACPTSSTTTNGTTTTVSLPLTIEDTADNQQSLAGFAPGFIHQVVTSPNSALAVVTYESATAAPGNAQLPVYTIPTQGTGTLTSARLTGAQATTPIAAIFSTDLSTIFVSTAGDSQIHIVSASTLQDTAQFSSALPDGLGGTTPAQFMAVRPRPIP